MKPKPGKLRPHAGIVRMTLWWLRHFEEIIHFWTGFCWASVIGLLVCAVIGIVDLKHALLLIFVCGIIGNTGVYLCIRTMANSLINLEPGPQKEEAHMLMIRIIRRRVFSRRQNSLSTEQVYPKTSVKGDFNHR